MPLWGYLSTGVHGWLLAFKAPGTLLILWRVLVGRNGADLWAFGSVDSGFRPWYQKIASDYQHQGRFGFAWDDGLGMALGPRIYNNWATYALLARLGTRNMAGLSLAMFSLISAYLVGLHFGLLAALVFILLALVSPMFVGLHTHLWKAEFFWWGAGVLFCYSALTQPGMTTGLLWSVIAMVNLPASVMLALLTAPVLLVGSLSQGSFMLLVLGVLPGAIKHGLRIYGMWRSGFLSSLTSEQARLWKRPWRPIGSELAWWVPFLLAVMAGSYSSGNWGVGMIVAGTGIFLYWANFRLIYFNDVESFHLGFWGLGLSMACLGGSWLGLAAMLVFAYTSPALCGFPLPFGFVASGDRRSRLSQEALARYRSYPALEAMPYPLPQPLREFFELIPDGARILAESDGDPRTQSKLRVFWVWSEGLLPLRGVDLVNEMYTRLNEPDLSDSILLRLNSAAMSQAEILETSLQLGVSHIVAWTDETVSALLAAGYIERGVVDLAGLEEFRRVIPCPPVVLRLLESPRPVGIIAPVVKWQRQSNELVWSAEAGKVYLVRYRYHPGFAAQQDGEMLPVEPYSPFPEVKLRFMRVTAVSDGPLTLRYKGRFIG